MRDLLAVPPQSVARPAAAWRLRLAGWSIALVVALIHSWVHRHGLVNLDAVSYLDIARDYARGDWPAALNGYWSPLYSWCLAVALAIVRPSPAFEYPMLHAVNFVLFVVGLAALDWLVGELRRRAGEDAGRAGLSPSGWQLAAMALFLWVAIELVVV